MSECSICHDPITSETGETKLGCAHAFHLKCIVTWLLTRNSCPCCRKEVGEHETIKNIPRPEPPSLEETISEFLAQLPGIQLENQVAEWSESEEDNS
jgi:hypothetical protein